MTNIIAVKITWFTVLISHWDHSGCLVARVCGCGKCGLWKRYVCVLYVVASSTGVASRVGRVGKLAFALCSECETLVVGACR